MNITEISAAVGATAVFFAAMVNIGKSMFYSKISGRILETKLAAMHKDIQNLLRK